MSDFHESINDIVELIDKELGLEIFVIFKENKDLGTFSLTYSAFDNYEYVFESLHAKPTEWHRMNSGDYSVVISSKKKIQKNSKKILNILGVLLKQYQDNLFLEELAYKDDVSGLYNTRMMYKVLDELIVVEKKDFALLFLDIDLFKNVNDDYGHLVGSRLLKDVSDIIRKEIRSNDFAFRYGGDEFVLILREGNKDLVYKVAERIQNKVKDQKFQINDKSTISLSFSIGIAFYPDDAKTRNEIISFADSMMYESKKSGRGKIFHLKEV